MLFNLNGIAQTYTTESTTTKKAQKLFDDAKASIMQNALDDCIMLVQKAVSEDPLFIDAYQMMGEVYFQQQKFDKAILPLEKVNELNEGYKSKLYYLLSVAYFETSDYNKSISSADKYLLSKDQFAQWTSDAKRLKNNSIFSIEALKNPVPFNPINLGANINTNIMDEYSPSITADNSILMYNRNVKAAERFQEDFYISKNENGVWQMSFDAGNTLNSSYNEGAQKISADGKYLFFTICNKPNAFGSCDIYIAENVNGTWSNVKNLGYPISMPTWDSQPSISADGMDLYFSSNRPGTKGDKDIFVSHKGKDGKWGIPENLGNNINTVFEEGYPYIHPDNQTLYFSSDGLPGLGGIDIYMSRKNSDGKWGVAQNLGYPINNKKDNNGLIVSLDGKTAYYASTPEGRYDLDIYKFDLPENIRPIPTTYVRGIITDKSTGSPIVANVELIDIKTGNSMMNVTSNSDGSFLESLPTGKEYAMNINKIGYLFASEHFSLLEPSTADKPYALNIALQRIAVNVDVSMNNIFFDTNSSNLKNESDAELQKLISFLTSNPKLKIEVSGHTDNTGNDASNKTLSENRAKAVCDYLIKNGIEPTRVAYKGYGSSKPILSNDTEEGRAKNRRTEFKITELQ